MITHNETMDFYYVSSESQCLMRRYVYGKNYLKSEHDKSKIFTNFHCHFYCLFSSSPWFFWNFICLILILLYFAIYLFILLVHYCCTFLPYVYAFTLYYHLFHLFFPFFWMWHIIIFSAAVGLIYFESLRPCLDWPAFWCSVLFLSSIVFGFLSWL